MHERGISRYSVRICLSHITEKSRRRTLLCFKRILVSNNFVDKRGRGIRNFHRNFLVSHYRNASERNPSVIQKNTSMENFHVEEGKGGFTILRQYFIVPRYRKNSHRNATVFQNISRAGNLWDKAEGGGRRSVTIFRRIFFRLNVPKKTRRKIFGVSENFGYQKVLCIIGRAGGWGILQFSVGNLLSHGTKKLRRGTFCVSENFWYPKNFCIAGVYDEIRILYRDVFVSLYRNFS